MLLDLCRYEIRLTFSPVLQLLLLVTWECHGTGYSRHHSR
jgi:hypothetical protein